MSKKQKQEVRLVTINENLGKLPPQATDLEDAVIGAVLTDKDALTTVIEFLRADHFYLEYNREIYEAAIYLFSESIPIDAKTMISHLKKIGKLELVGGQIKIWELSNSIASAANIEYHARVIIEQAIKRELIKVAARVHCDGYDDTKDVFEILGEAQRDLDKINGSNIKGAPVIGKHVYEKAMKELAKGKSENGITGVPSGFALIDRNTGGWQNSDLIIIAARPGMGKTAFVVNALRNTAVDHKIPVAIFSLEMAAEQLMNRMIASESEVMLDRILKRTMSEEEYSMVINKSSKLYSAPYFIDDTANLSIMEFRAKARKLKAEHDIKLIIVDYLQLMKGEGGNREQEISSISRGLKIVAKELQIPVIALSQLSRGVESRGGDKMPMLSDLRESGSIEQDADIVAFIYRAEYYKINTYADGESTAGKMDFIIAKHRNGAQDIIRLRFIGKYTKVMNLDYSENPAYENNNVMKNLKPITVPIEVRDITQSARPNDDDLPF